MPSGCWTMRSSGCTAKPTAAFAIDPAAPADALLACWRIWSRPAELTSYGPSLPDLFRRAATYVDNRFLKGAKCASLAHGATHHVRQACS